MLACAVDDRRPGIALSPHAGRARLPGDRRGQLCRARARPARAQLAHGELRAGRRDRRAGGLLRRRDDAGLLRQRAAAELLRLRSGRARRDGQQPRRRRRRARCSACSSRPPTSWSAASSPRWPCSSCSSSSCWRAPRALPAQPPHGAYDGRRHDRASAPAARRRSRGSSAFGCRAAVPGAAASSVSRCRCSAIAYLGRDRHARLHLLGAGRRASISWSALPGRSPSAGWRC